MAQDYQQHLNDFAAASFRGASLSPLSTMLSARSANDFLDQSTVVARIAQQSRRTMAAASAAQATAQTAAAAAQTAQRSAAQAASAAAQARSTAAVATDTAKIRKGQLDAAVVTSKALYGKLSAQERQAAAAAAAKARAASEAAARAALEQQRQAAAQLQAQQQAARQRSLEQAAAEQRAQQQAAAAPPMPGVSTATTSRAATSPVSAAPVTADSMLQASVSPQAAAAPSPSTAASAAGPSAAPPMSGGGDNLGQIVAQAALTKVGGGYCYACDGPTSYDCSGLTTWAWAQAGISIPRVSYEQAKFPVVPMDQLQPGDLVTYYSPVSHVAIYVGNGMIVSAVDEQSGIMYRAVGRGGPNAVGHRVPRS